MFKVILSAIGVILVVMAIVGVAARGARPGDALYAYRTSVREPILRAFHTTQEHRGKYESQLLQARYEDLLFALANKDAKQLEQALDAFAQTRSIFAGRIETAAVDKGLVPLAGDLFASYDALFRTYGSLVTYIARTESNTKLLASMEFGAKEHVRLKESVTRSFKNEFKEQSVILRFDESYTELTVLRDRVTKDFAQLPKSTSQEMKNDLAEVLTEAEATYLFAKDRHDRDLDLEAYQLLNMSAADFQTVEIYMGLAGSFPMPKLSK